MLDTLFFDGDQTLWDFDKVMRRALGSTLLELQSLRPEAEQLTVDTLIADRQSVAAVDKTHEQLRQLAFQHTLTTLGVHDDALANHLTTFYFDRRFAEVELYPDTLDALGELNAAGYALGLLSNGNSYPERPGLARFFDFTVFAQDHGVAKPDPELFRIAAARAGRAAESIAMIGDSLKNDVTAAQASGWRGIWLNRTSASCTAPHLPDATIGSLAELGGVLKELDPGQGGAF